MNAKEERARNLEIHKINRINHEYITKNVTLESECKRLRIMIKQESEKHAASQAAMVHRMNAAIELEREKMNELRSHFEKEQDRLVEQSYKDAIAQRTSHMELLGDIKMHWDIKYTEKINENKAALDAAMRDLEQERERIKRDEHTQLFRITEEREKLNREFNDARERIKRNEKEQVIQFLSNMEMEREKVQRQTETERAIAMEEVHKEIALQRQLNDETIKEMNRVFTLNWDEKMKKYEMEMKEMRRTEEERIAQRKKDDVLIAEMKEEQEEMRKRVAEMKEEQLIVEQANKDIQIQRQELDEEKERNSISFDAAMQKLIMDHQQFKNTKMIEERKMQALKMQMEAETNKHALHISEIKQQLNEKMMECQQLAEYATAMVSECTNSFKIQLNAERDKMKAQFAREKLVIEQQLHAEIKELQADIVHYQQLVEHANADVSKYTNSVNIQLNKERDKMKAQLQLTADMKQQMEEQLNEKMMECQQLAEHANARVAECTNSFKIQLNAERDKMKAQFAREKLVIEQQLNSEINELQSDIKRITEMESVLYCDVKKELHDAVNYNFQHMRLIVGLDFKDKRVIIYSHYSEYNEVESYNILSLECIEHYFDYVIILTNCPNKWNIQSPNYNKYYVMAYNMKSDFRNYGVFIMQSEKVLNDASCLCFMNDSFVVVDVNACGLCMKNLFTKEMTTCDFAGLTSSHEGGFHLQSYFLCFNSSTIPHVLTYFEKHGLPANHSTAISVYELGITKYLKDVGFLSYAVVSNDDMRVPLNTTCCKWEMVLTKTGIIKRQHFLKQYAYAAMTDANIAMVAEKHSYNKHFIHFLMYHGINQKSVK